jgi:hypothetical protein
VPEIPNPQSRLTSPGGSGLGAAPPDIVGGGAIVQGLSTLAQGLLTVAAQQRMQQQADQISQAGKIFGTVSEALDNKAQELRNRQAEQPTSPLLVGQEFRDYANTLVADTLAEPSVAEAPFMAKYLAAHLPQALHSRMQAFNSYTNATWQQWDQFETSTALQGFRDAAVRDPAAESEMLKQAQALLRGKTMAGTLTGEQATKAWTDINASVTYGRGLLYAKSHAQSWVDATNRGTFPPGFDPSRYTHEQLKELDGIARETFSLITSTAKDQDTQHRRELSDGYEEQKNLWLSRHLPHQDESGKMRRAETVEKVLTELGTNRSKALLGTQWDTVHTFYQSLDQHMKSAGGVKPKPSDYNAVLEGIYKGTYKSSLDVLNAASGKNFDIPSTNEVLGKFETERGHLDRITQERIRQSIDVIKGRFALPGGAALDPADSQGRMNTVLTRHFFWLEGLRAKGGSALQEADLIGTAQKMAEQEYLNMANHVITIVPRTEASLVYKTPNEVNAALKKGEITEHQANSYLLEIEQFHQLQTIAGGKTPSLGQGRSEAFK